MFGEGGPFGLTPGEGADRPTSGGDHHGGGRPECPDPHHWAPVTSRPLPSLVLQGRLPLVPSHRPGPGSNGSRPGAIAVAERRPSAPTPMPLTGTATPGTGPGAGPGAWSREGQQQSAPSMAPDILSYGRRPPPPSNLGGQSHPHRPPVTTSRRHRPAVITTWRTMVCRPSRGGRCHPGGCRGPWTPPDATTTGAQRTGPRPLPWPPMVTGPGFPASPTAARRPLPTRPPLPAPGGKPGDGTPTPPVSICPVRKFFHFSVRGKSEGPRGRDPPQFFTQQNSAG